MHDGVCVSARAAALVAVRTRLEELVTGMLLLFRPRSSGLECGPAALMSLRSRITRIFMSSCVTYEETAIEFRDSTELKCSEMKNISKN